MCSDSFCLLCWASHFILSRPSAFTAVWGGRLRRKSLTAKELSCEAVVLIEKCKKNSPTQQPSRELTILQSVLVFQGLALRSFGMFAVPHYLCFANTHFSVSNFSFSTAGEVPPRTSIILRRRLLPKASFRDYSFLRTFWE